MVIAMSTHNTTVKKKDCPVPPGTLAGPMSLPVSYNLGQYKAETKNRASNMQNRRKRYKVNKLMDLPSVY